MAAPQKYPRPTTPVIKPLAWSGYDVKSVAAKLDTDPDWGLSEAAARARQGRYGPNRPSPRGPERGFAAFCRRIACGRTLVMALSALTALAVGARTEALCLAFGEILGQVLAMAWPRKPQDPETGPLCRVCRQGRLRSMDPRYLVPGDLVRIHAGDLIQADLRLTRAQGLIVDETHVGGLAAAEKNTAPVSPDADLSRMTSMAWLGTRVDQGQGTGMVVATGDHTEWVRQHSGKTGYVAWPLDRQGLPDDTPRQTAVFMILAATAVLATGWAWHLPWPHMAWCMTALLAAAAVQLWSARRPAALNSPPGAS